MQDSNAVGYTAVTTTTEGQSTTTYCFNASTQTERGGSRSPNRSPSPARNIPTESDNSRFDLPAYPEQRSEDSSPPPSYEEVMKGGHSSFMEKK